MTENKVYDFRQKPRKYLEQRQMEVPEDEVEFLGLEKCPTCTWRVRTFRATDDHLVYRILHICPYCFTQDRVDELFKT